MGLVIGKPELEDRSCSESGNEIHSRVNSCLSPGRIAFMLRVCCTTSELLWHHHLPQSRRRERAWRMLSEHQQAQHSKKDNVCASVCMHVSRAMKDTASEYSEALLCFMSLLFLLLDFCLSEKNNI